jgi:hypothetical protein
MQFARVDAAVAAKQDFETDEIKNQFEAQGQNLTREQISGADGGRRLARPKPNTNRAGGGGCGRISRR